MGDDVEVGPPSAWRTPEELVLAGLEHSRLVVANEAHDGLARCVRTRVIGRRMVEAAHGAGVRHLALEALYPAALAAEANRTRQLPESAGYLGQPEMRALIGRALAARPAFSPPRRRRAGAIPTTPMPTCCRLTTS